MTKRSLWRLIFVTLTCAACAFFFYPLDKVKLGLDLKGGVHFELEVQGQEALEADLRDSKDRLQDTLRQKGLPNASVRLEQDSLVIDGVSADDRSSLDKPLASFPGYRASNEANGRVRLSQRPDYQKQIKDDASKRALMIIENRINQFGVAEPEITQSGPEGNRIVVELPGVGDAERERIKGLLMTPGRLELRLLARQGNPRGYRTYEEAMAALGGTLPPDTELLPEPVNELKDARGGKAPAPVKHGPDWKPPIQAWYLMETKVQFDGTSITDARRAVDQNTDRNEINFTLDHKGAEINYQVSVWSVEEGRYFAFCLDRKIVSVLSARERIPGNSVRITGNFSQAEADDLSLKLKSGAMRASMKFLEERAMGPGLGADSIHKGVRASVIGFAVIIGFMVFYYKWSGLNAIVALTVNIIVMLGLLGSFKAVLTLPGIAGFALTIGMAVDANILIFERIREELANGKSVAGAIQLGFDRVFWTIVDSHVTQLFAALLLFIFGTGPVKGFAVTLTVGVVASLFTSIYISRFIYDWVLERHPGTKTLSI